jgi:hypothetical protein
MGDQIVEVDCYSGSTYAERPQAVIWHGKRIPIKRCLQSQQTPRGKLFDVLLEDDRIVRLLYLINEEHWIVSG